MLRFRCLIVALLFCVAAVAGLRAQDRPYSLGVLGSLNTSSKLFYRPNDPDELIRNGFQPFDNTIGGGLDLRRQFEPLGISLGLSIEYLSKTQSFTDSLSQSPGVSGKDGFTVFPLELSAYFAIPVGSDIVQLFMGAGAGAYFGERQYEYGGVRAEAVDRTTGYGIHILGGVQYFLRPSLSLRSQLKFRNVQFETVNRFPDQAALSTTGTPVPLSQEPFASRVTIDGMTLSLDLVYHF